MMPLGGILVASLYFAFTAVLWIGLQRKPSPEQAAHASVMDAALDQKDAPVTQATTDVASDPDSGEPELTKEDEVLKIALFLFGMTVLIHALVGGAELVQALPQTSLSNAFSATTWLMMAVLIFLCQRLPLHALLLFFAPIAGIAALFSGFSHHSETGYITDYLVYAHLSMGLLGFALCLMSVPLAFVSQLMSRQLRSGQEIAWLRKMPALAVIETLIIRLIIVSTVLLTLSILFALPSITDIGEQHLAHKIFFSCFAIGTLLSLLIGHWRYGWRGRKLANLTYLANFCLLLAYFGTKLVLEWMLIA